MAAWSGQIEVESPADEGAVRAVELAAFGRMDEADLVDRLRGTEDWLASLVARGGGSRRNGVIGHALLTRVALHAADGPVGWGAGLGPVAVQPEEQRHGIGAALCLGSIERARALGAPVIVVLGEPGYYGRLGFEPAARLSLRCQWDVPDGCFMALSLTGAGPGPALVRYSRAFDSVT